MKQDLPETQQELLKEFPNLELRDVTRIDILIKTKLKIYESCNMNSDISAAIQKEISKSCKYKNEKKIKKKCNKIAAQYIKNEKIWIVQENWYCILAYLITIVTMILRVIEVEQKVVDVISFAMYTVAMILWLVIVKSEKLMGASAHKFLIAFNNHAPSMIIVSSMVFYLCVCCTTCRWILIAVIVISVILCIDLTLLWYKREMKE